jgi:class 3 adenylate cyclase
MISYFRCIVLLFTLLFISCKTQVNPRLIIARQGRIDLSTWDIAKNGKISLDGEWEFYGNQLLTPDDFKKDSSKKPDDYIMVPGAWNDQKIKAEKFTGQYATYRLTIINYSGPDLLALRLWEVNSSYLLWVNDRIVASNGKISSNRDSVVVKEIPQVKIFRKTAADSLQIVIQVANFFHARGGLRSSIDFGRQEDLIRERDIDRTVESWLAGALFILFIYHFLIFILNRRETAAFWFALLCLDSTIRIIITGEHILYTTFPDFPLAIGMRIEYLTITLGVPIYSMLSYEFFKKEWSVSIRNIMLVLGGLQSLVICFSPVVVFTGLLIYVQAIVLLDCFYLVYIVVRAMINKRDFAIISGLSYGLCFAGIIHDILVSQLIINDPFMLFYFFTVFLVMQAYILAYRNSRAYNEIEFLSEELNEANITLENKVEERTKQLNASNFQLADEKRKTDELLLNILPAEIAEELRETGSSRARRFPSVTVMFTDFKDFTRLSEELTPEQLVNEIDYCYRQFDQVIEKYGLEKIKTMGDAYICAGGLPTMNFTHPEDAVRAALDIRDFMDQIKSDKTNKNEPFFEIRIGVHTGPVVAGIVGSKKFAYDIWGDTVNLAARMQSSGEISKVNISDSTYQMIKDKFSCTRRGKVEAKNKGVIDMYFVERK